PVTSYQLRSQCCPVQSWVQRCQYVPVTAYQQSFYYEPVTSCCSTPVAPLAAPVAAVPPAPLGGATVAPPIATEQGSAAPPAVRESTERGGNGSQPYNRSFYPQGSENGQPRSPAPTQEPMPRASGISFQPVVPRLPANPVPTPPPPKVRLDRIVAVPQSQVEGQVVREGQDPWAG